METVDTRIVFFMAAAFGMIYGTTLIGTSAHYCVQLDTAYNQLDCTQSENGSALESFDETRTLADVPSADIFCDRYTKWRACSIVGMFAGTLILIYTIGNIYCRYSVEDDYTNLDEDDSQTCLHFGTLASVAIISFLMITSVFSILIDTKADQALRTPALTNIVVLGFGVGVPVLGILVMFVLTPVIKCTKDVADALA